MHEMFYKYYDKYRIFRIFVADFNYNVYIRNVASNILKFYKIMSQMYYII